MLNSPASRHEQGQSFEDRMTDVCEQLQRRGHSYTDANIPQLVNRALASAIDDLRSPGEGRSFAIEKAPADSAPARSDFAARNMSASPQIDIQSLSGDLKQLALYVDGAQSPREVQTRLQSISSFVAELSKEERKVLNQIVSQIQNKWEIA
jgi:hypothetical protein